MILIFMLKLPRWLLVVVTSVCCAAEAEDVSFKFFKDLAETRNYTLGRPVSPKLTPDGAEVVYLRGGPRDPVLRLYEFDVAHGKEREILTPSQLLNGTEEQLTAEEKARRERARVSLKGFTNFQLSKDGTQLLVTLSGKLYRIIRPDFKVTALPGQNWIDPHFSPDGSYVAAAQAGELHVIDLKSNTAASVTSGAGRTLSHGVAEFVAQEEMDRREGFWWSPDSQWLAYQETDESKVETRYITDPLHPEAPPQKFFYPHAGSTNATVRLGVISRAGGETHWIKWDQEKYPYLCRVVWKEPNSPLCLYVMNRAQQEAVLLAADPTTGETRELLKETDSGWINLDDQAVLPVWLKGGKQFLWTTERHGAWQIELHAADGTFVRNVTPIAFGYRGFVAIDEEAQAVYVRGSDDPREVQVWRFSLSNDSGVPLTKGRGHHDAVFSENHRTWVHTSNLFQGPKDAEVINFEGKILAKLPFTTEPASHPISTQLTRTEGEFKFDAAITLPHELSVQSKNNGKKYPVILYVYAGPTSKRVNALDNDYFLDQWMADQGYIVARIDGRGTPWHGRDWERVIRGNFIDIALNDQIDGLHALAKRHPEMDLSRVGVTGWSFGGYFSAMATIRRPDVFKAGVAGAPVVTWENYDTFYTERYIGLPQQDPKAYKVSDVTSYVSELKRPLMLIHGLTDDNVYFQHTLQLADALYMAGKPYELLPMLGTHMVSDPLVRLRQQQRVMNFFNLELKSRGTPDK